MKAKRTMTLDADVDAILESISAGQSSASAYVEDLVRDAEQDWRAAHRMLSDLGWTPTELLAACDVLNGFHLVSDFGRPASWAAAEIADAPHIAEKWDVPSERWAELARRIGESETEARALAGLAREFWRMNPRVEAVLRRDSTG